MVSPMDAKVWVVTSGKGGVGKTTTTANVGTALAQRGKKTVIIDVDMGLRNLDVVMGLESRVVYDLSDVISGRCSLKQALIQDKRNPKLYMLPASQSRDKDALDTEVFKKTVEELLGSEFGFEMVLIDCPAGIEQGFRTASAPAQGAIVVVNPEVSSVRDADRVIGLLQAQGVKNIGLVINRLRSNMIAKGDMLTHEDVHSILGERILALVPEDEQVIISTNTGEPMVQHAGKPGALAANAFLDAARRVMGEDLPLTLPAEPTRRGFMQNVRALFGRG